MAYMMIQDTEYNDGRPKSYQSAEFFANNTVVTTIDNTYKLVKEFSLDLTEVNWLQMDYEAKAAFGGCSFDLREVTGGVETHVSYPPSIDDSGTDYVWRSTVFDFSSYTGVHTFRLYCQQYQGYTTYHRGLNFHKNSVQRVFWA
jgi:hypothetical protein